MKKRYLLFPALTALTLAGCTLFDSNSEETNTPTNSVEEVQQETLSEHAGNNYDYTTQITVEDPGEIEVEEVTEEFSLTTSDGEIEQNDNVFTLKTAGTYSLTGKLEGQILVDAGDDDQVEIELNNVSISYDLDSPIKVLNADKVEISAKKGTGNIVTDNRAHKVNDEDSQGEGAISAKCDLKLKGTGKLIVEGNYNNGVHTTKDLTIQKETLKVTGYNNAIKGKNSVTIVSGEVQAYAQTGNGIKTENTDVSSKGNQRGNISIQGGSVYVDSLHDGLDASYNIEVDQADDEVLTSLVVKCGTQSTSYSKSTFVSSSEKGLKAQNEVIVNKGTIVVAASDDAIHANYGDALENGNSGIGNITVNDGIIKIASGDDGLHADNTLTINGGSIYVTGSYEGLEANYIVINDGETYVYGSDDGVNVAKKSFSTCSFTMNGGYLDVAVSNGDTDGIDSNGTVTIAGGIIITRGSPGTGSGMSTGLDVDGTCSMTGGTLIAFNGLEKTPSTSSNVKYAGTSGANSGNGGPGGGGPGGGPKYPGQGGSSSYSFQGGEYTLSGDGIDVSFVNDFSYTKFAIYSSNLVSNATYTLSRGESTVLSWTQSSNSVTIS